MALLSTRRKTTKQLRAATFVAAAGLLALPGLANAADETFNNVKTIPVPNMTSFDISWVDVATGSYLLADRSNQSVDVANVGSPFFLTNEMQAGFTGVFTSSTGAVNNDLSGPNGVITYQNAAGDEVWVGDGPNAQPGCPSFLSKCSAVKVLSFNGTTGNLTHTIITNGAARADELCSDPVDGVVLIANDAEADFSFGTPFISFISTNTYKIFNQVQIPEATNGIEQCKWDKTTGYFFINIPEINGPGNDTADGAVYVFDAHGNRVARYFIDQASEKCAGPQGMAVGPEPQLLLGCNAPVAGVRNSLIINKHTGAPIAILSGMGGSDEVYFNTTDSHYALTDTKDPVHVLNVVDANGPTLDQTVALPTFGTVSQHSVAIDPFLNQVWVPNNGEILVYQNSGDDADDPGTNQLSN